MDSPHAVVYEVCRLQLRFHACFPASLPSTPSCPRQEKTNLTLVTTAIFLYTIPSRCEYPTLRSDKSNDTNHRQLWQTENEVPACKMACTARPSADSRCQSLPLKMVCCYIRYVYHYVWRQNFNDELCLRLMSTAVFCATLPSRATQQANILFPFPSMSLLMCI